MSIELNQRAFDHAEQLVAERRFVLDDRDAWSEHQPSTREENEFIAQHGLGEYAKWYLGVDTEQNPETKSRYRFPYGDFEKVHRCGVLTAESRAAQYGHDEIERAAAHLHGMLEAAKVLPPAS